MVGDQLNPSRTVIQALRIVQKEIELAGGGRDKIHPFKGKNGKLVEMYVAAFVLEHIVAYLAGEIDD